MIKIYIRYICLPLILVGALCYSIVSLFSLDILELFFNEMMVKTLHVMVGIASVSVVVNNIAWDRKK